VSSLVRHSHRSPGPIAGKLWVLGGCLVIFLAAFLLLPGDISIKTHAALHGLCAQRPSHSLHMGGSILPLDARMTGIYIGAATTAVALLVAGRLRATATLPRSVLSMLAVFVLVMAIDGFNALLVDLDMPHAYEPSNILRLITGILAGTSLGVAVGYLFAITMWVKGNRREAIVPRPAALLGPLAVSATFGALAMSGLPILYAPIAVGLVVAVFAVFWAFSIVVLALVTDRAWRSQQFGDMADLAIAAGILGAAMIGLFSGLRFLAERYLGLPQLT
jgi:uncharacterized membrane protein